MEEVVPGVLSDEDFGMSDPEDALDVIETSAQEIFTALSAADELRQKSRRLGGTDRRYTGEICQIGESATRLLRHRSRSYVHFIVRRQDDLRRQAEEERKRREATSQVALALERIALWSSPGEQGG